MMNRQLIDFCRRRTDVQQLTCNIDLSRSFYYLFFSFVLLELKPLFWMGKVLGDKFWQSVKNSETEFCPLSEKILVSVKFAILGPEMAAPILWAPGKNALFLQERPMSIKFLVLGGEGWGEYFYGRGDFSDFSCCPLVFLWLWLIINSSRW